MFPATRYRRLRRTSTLRSLVRETPLDVKDLIMPFFVRPGRGVRNPISSMPGQSQYSLDQLLLEVGKAKHAGIKAILLFGLPKKKDAVGSEAFLGSGIVQAAVRALKKKYPTLVVMADLCFCEYTLHGHCGVVKRSAKGARGVDNDATLKNIRRAALAQARAGADFVAPSGMMDGAVAAIRQALDKNGFKDTGVLSYAAKYASAFYGPFREAAASAPQFGDRRSYQMDPGNVREALREIEEDVKEGADMVMVKPALSYLDVIREVRSRVQVPVVAYNVSGEYSMVKAAEQLGWLDSAHGPRAALEILTSIKRAGADLIITYHALEVAPYLK